MTDAPAGGSRAECGSDRLKVMLSSMWTASLDS